MFCKKENKRENTHTQSRGDSGFAVFMATYLMAPNSGVRGGGKCPEEEHST